ncbi:MAG: hypothetical protein MZV64_11080 [Ignavibacteriales bacterium]|nr:hypothetical protein [Ignavibacteriales bacterium]
MPFVLLHVNHRRRHPGRVELPDVRHDRRIRRVFPGLRREPARLRPQGSLERDRVHPFGLVLTGLPRPGFFC